MSRLRMIRTTPRLSFPRVSGDEPCGDYLQTIEFKFSPRERG